MGAFVSDEQLAKIGAWIVELEARQKKLGASRTGYLRFFVGALAVSGLGFVWNLWFGVGAFLTGILFCAFGFYVVLVRESDYRHEIAQLRKDAERLRSVNHGDEIRK